VTEKGLGALESSTRVVIKGGDELLVGHLFPLSPRLGS